MYYVLIFTMVLTVIGSFFCASVVVNFDVTEGQKNMLAIMITCFVASFGYFLELISYSEDGIFNAMRFRYMGLALMMLFFCEYIFYYVGAKKPRFFFKLIGLVDYVLLNFMWFTNHIPFFFKKYTFIDKGEESFFDIEYGIGYHLYIINSFIIPSVCAMYVLYKKAREHNVKNYRMINFLMLVLISVPLEYISTRYLPHIDECDFSLPFITLLFSLTVLASWKFGNYVLDKLSVKTVINEITDQILVINDMGYIVDCNEAATNILKLKPGMYIQKQYPIFQDFPDVSSNIFQLNDRVFELHAKEIIEKNKYLQGYIMLLTDVTHVQKQMEELKVLKEKAEESNRAKSLFLSNMSHEIRTPMNSIMGITEVLLREKMTEQEREYLLNIRNSGNSLISIINDILDFSKVESGMLEIEENEYDPIAMLNDLGLMFMSRLGDKPVELLYYIDPNLPRKLIGDEIRVRQVIINIVNNAIKYTQEGKIEFTWKVEKKTKDGVICFFQVKDTGCGISEKDMPKLFNTFSRIESEMSNSIEGTGLGLSICKAYVEKMNGDLWVDSKLGLGSIFYFRIPQGIADESPSIWIDEEKKNKLSLGMAFVSPILKRYYFRMAEKFSLDITDVIANPYSEKMYDYLFTDSQYYNEHMVSNLAKKTVVIQNVLNDKAPEKGIMIGKKPFYEYPFCMILNEIKEKIDTNEHQSHTFQAPEAKVLLVDDNQMNRKVACDLLRPLNMKFDTAENGEEAVFLFENRHYDLILMDHMMPVMDGEEATKKIRSMEEGTSHIPIIALTANAIVGAKDQLLQSGMDDFVTKPIALKELYEVLYKWLPNEKIVLCDNEDTLVDLEADFEEKEYLEKNGFDIKTALFYCGSVKMYMELLKDFYTMLPYKKKMIEDYEQENNIKEYVVEVHSMKTSLKTVGMPKKSEYFLELEMAGKQGNTEFIHERTKDYLKMLDALHEILAPICKNSEKGLKEVPKDKIVSLLSMMLEALDVFDFDAVDSFLEELNTYQFPEKCQTELENLRIFVADVSYGKVKDSINKLLKDID